MRTKKLTAIIIITSLILTLTMGTSANKTRDASDPATITLNYRFRDAKIADALEILKDIVGIDNNAVFLTGVEDRALTVSDALSVLKGIVGMTPPVQVKDMPFGPGVKRDWTLYMEHCEQAFSPICDKTDFVDNQIVVIFSRAMSRNNRTFTPSDFKDIGAISVGNVSRLRDWENAYAQRLWEAELALSLNPHSFDAQQEYNIARSEAEANVYRKLEYYRQMIVVTLDKKCEQNVRDVIQKLHQQMQERKYIIYVEPNYICEPE